MTPAHLAALHARCFTSPRPWTATEFENLLDGAGVFLLSAPDAILLGRCAGPEAELLTLAVAPERRRSGVGRKLLKAFEDAAVAQGAEDAFLEVASDNSAARALYAQAGYTEAGRRPGYYKSSDGTAVDALILRKRLSHT